MFSTTLASAFKGTHTRGFATLSVKLPALPYDYSALEPAISGKIMELHHAKHHQTYVNNFNAAQEQHAEAEAKGDVAKMISLHMALKFNGGGHVNHTLFWENLAPKGKGGGDLPSGELAKMIDAKWGSFDAFKTDFSTTTAAIQGSGWGWLSYCRKEKGLVIKTTANQDPCLTAGAIPLLGVDVWEHAYYLDYKNVRPDYLKAVFSVLNWKVAGERLAKAKA